VFARTRSLVTAATRARLPHTVRIFAGARTAETRPGVRIPGLSGRRASVFLRRPLRRAGDGYKCRQCNDSQHTDFRSHANSSHKGCIMAKRKCLGCDPRCVPDVARAEIISALLFAAAATAILAKRLARKQKLPWGNQNGQRQYLGKTGPDRHIERLFGYWCFGRTAKLAVKDFGAAAKRMKVEIVMMATAQRLHGGPINNGNQRFTYSGLPHDARFAYRDACPQTASTSAATAPRRSTQSRCVAVMPPSGFASPSSA
jgi:hypothetical protein